MPEKKDIKKAMDEILADEFSAEDLQAIELFQRVASWDRTDRPGEGNVTKTSFIIPGKFCELQRLLDVSGSAGTGPDGKARFRLKRFICLDSSMFEHPINFVATPLTSKPVFLTFTRSLVMDPTGTFGIDVEFEVFTWNANGAPAPKIAFNWRCRVPFEEGPD